MLSFFLELESVVGEAERTVGEGEREGGEGEVGEGRGDSDEELLDLLLDRARHGGVADVRVDLGEELRADDHRLDLGVVDVRRDDGAAASDL